MLNQDSYPSAEVDLHTALAFLHRDAIVLPDAPRGYVLSRYEGLALGFVKNLGNRCNNLHPQGRRIRMDINNVDSK
jgi:NOL1/NOP2/fmu family ribosome biogenesis protein